jgi:hypothetical protein
MKTTLSLLALLLLVPAVAFSSPPPMPVYDGCVSGDWVRIVTGKKKVLNRDEKPLNLSPYDGKRIRFKGYLKMDPILVMVDEKPTVLGACREAPHLPLGKDTLEQALARSRKIPTSKAGQPDGPCRAAVVKATSAPLHSGEVDGRQLLSNHFELVESLSGTWPKKLKLIYLASVPDNERAVMKGEKVIVIPVEDKRLDALKAGTILKVGKETRAKVKAAAKACGP